MARELFGNAIAAALMLAVIVASAGWHALAHERKF
jgi:hypothetical protein